MPILRIKLPNRGEVTHVLSGEKISIGRRPDNTIQILDQSVSGHHAEFIAVDNHYRLHDLQSTNLSFVDGQPVTDFHLHGSCRVAFGIVECDFDAGDKMADAPTMTVAQLEHDVAFLRGENSELLGKLDMLQRRIDILNSARLVTGRTDQAPGPAAADSHKAVAHERDDLRHQTIGLKLELDQIREELACTARERDEARQRLERLHIEKVGLHRELKEASAKLSAPPPDTARAEAAPLMARVDDSAITQRLIVGPPPSFDRLPPILRQLRTLAATLATAPSDAQAGAEAARCTGPILEKVLPLGDHALVRLAHGMDDLLRDFDAHSDPARAAMMRTLLQAIDLFGTLLGPAEFERGKSLPPPHILAIDDDAELLATIVASLQLGQIQTDAYGSAEEALGAVTSCQFDLLLLDVRLPGIDGPGFCATVRELPGYEKTPIVFLTITDTAEQRAEALGSGGTDFISKPFSVFDLALKVQTWVLRQQVGLL